jgi:hypothetical protein
MPYADDDRSPTRTVGTTDRIAIYWVAAGATGVP